MRCITLASRVCERSDQQLRHGGTYWEWHLKVLDGKGLRLSCCSVVGEGSGPRARCTKSIPKQKHFQPGYINSVLRVLAHFDIDALIASKFHWCGLLRLKPFDL